MKNGRGVLGAAGLDWRWQCCIPTVVLLAGIVSTTGLSAANPYRTVPLSQRAANASTFDEVLPESRTTNYILLTFSSAWLSHRLGTSSPQICEGEHWDVRFLYKHAACHGGERDAIIWQLEQDEGRRGAGEEHSGLSVKYHDAQSGQSKKSGQTESNGEQKSSPTAARVDGTWMPPVVRSVK